MRNLLNFIVRYSHWFLFVLLEVVCFVLLFRFNNYQGSVYFTSANRVAGTVYGVSSRIISYFHLSAVNDSLTDRNIELEQEAAALRARLLEMTSDTLMADSVSRAALEHFTKIRAHVVNNTLDRTDNFITIDRGEADSVRSEMGVVCGQGVVGIVGKTASHHSLVISLLNTKSNVSCKIKNREYFGYLRWDGRDPRYTYLHDLPRHAVCHKGDTIVTSGYSSIFPEGIMVGTVQGVYDSHDGLSYQLKIKLAVDFGKLNDVRVVFRKDMEEQRMLEMQKEAE